MINIEIKQGQKLPGIRNAFISFVDFNERLINRVRRFKDRVYDPKTKCWEISLCDLEQFIAYCDGTPINIYLSKELKNVVEIPKDYLFKTQPFQHQKIGIEFALNHDNFILADEQGLGKTFQLINTACIRKKLGLIKQCLIICCVNSIKYNWKKEVELHSNETAFVLGTRFRKNGKPYAGSVQDRIDDLLVHKEFFLITNMETLRNDEFIKVLNDKCPDINMIALDESHFCRNNQSSQAKGLLKLQRFKYKVAMSGTPIVNRPLDAYTSLKWLGLEKANFTAFRRYYCNYDSIGGHSLGTIIGYRNMDKLRQSLANNMLRRLKDDELDLPDKIQKIEYIEMSDNQRKIYNEVRDQLLQDIDLIVKQNNPLSQLLRLRQATGDTSILSSTIHESAKLDRMCEIVDEISQNGSKCLVVSNWTTMTTKIKERLQQYNPAYITGEVSDIDREAEKNKFQTDPECQVCIGTIGALGTGLTLTAANTVIFMDLPWHRAAYDQCSDRVHRIGQKRNVTIIKMICVDTIDEKINSIIMKKGATADLLVDGKVQKISKQELLDLIN